MFLITEAELPFPHMASKVVLIISHRETCGEGFYGRGLEVSLIIFIHIQQARDLIAKEAGKYNPVMSPGKRGDHEFG